MSKKVLVEFWANKSGAKKHLKNLFLFLFCFVFWSFFVGAVFSTVLVHVSRERMKKGAIYELDSHFKGKYTLGK